jgi:hypothetical protein
MAKPFTVVCKAWESLFSGIIKTTKIEGHNLSQFSGPVRRLTYTSQNTIYMLEKLLALTLGLLFSFSLTAQIKSEDLTQIKAYEDSLIVDAFLVVNDTLASSRFTATKRLIFHLKSALKFDHSYEFKFDRLKSLSIQYAPDNSFRIFTWQLKVDQQDYRYFGAIQMNTPEVQLIPLADRSMMIEDASRAQLDAFNWYGSLYYNIKQVEYAGKPAYLLFGYDTYEYRDRRKVLDVLQFDADNKAVFGAPIIPNSDGGMQSRLILEYYGDSSVRLNYDEALEMIVYDHLITIPGKDGQGPIQVSDGSYEGIKIVNNQLVHEDKLFDNQAVSEPPRDEPVLGASKRDLFGREKRKN